MASVSTWTPTAIAAAQCGVSETIVKQFNLLLEQGCTVPFISRYRAANVNNLPPADLRVLEETLEELKHIQKKVKSILKANQDKITLVAQCEKGEKTLPKPELDHYKQCIMPPVLINKLTQCTTMTDVTELVRPYHEGGIGLQNVLYTSGIYMLAESLLKTNNTDLYYWSTIKDKFPYIASNWTPKDLAKHIIECAALALGRHPETFTYLKRLILDYPPTIAIKLKNGIIGSDEYSSYENFSKSIVELKPHQVLAINRGEKKKCLTVTINFSNKILESFGRWFKSSFSQNKIIDRQGERPFITNFTDNIIITFWPKAREAMTRRIRTALTAVAIKTAIKVFQHNLKSILLSQPLRLPLHSTLMAIDPGFTHGCKAAILSSTCEPLWTGVLRLFYKPSNSMTDEPRIDLKEVERLQTIIKTHNVGIVGIGDGIGARDTERVISKIVKSNNNSRSTTNTPLDGEMSDEPQPKLQFTTVSEAGVSVWSVAPDAETEFPKLTPGLRSAISLGRRLLDPLGEYTRVDPQHLGVGLYQLDIPGTTLQKALYAVTEECVSLVGVDLNTAPLHLLNYIAGIGTTRSTAILERRQSVGPFQNRSELLKVKGIGPKTFEQCAGFLKVYGNEPLDRTWIHPDAYPAARTLVQQLCGLQMEDLGTPEFRETIMKTVKAYDTMQLCEMLHIDSNETLLLIIKGLTEGLGMEDMREGHEPPLLRDTALELEDISVGMELIGRIRNVTPFGVFIDIGVGVDGLLHISRLPSGLWIDTLVIGSIMNVIVTSVDIVRSKPRIGLAPGHQIEKTTVSTYSASNISNDKDFYSNFLKAFGII